MGRWNCYESASRILTGMMRAHATITGLSLRRDASMQIGWGFGGREGARTPDLLVANDKLAVQDLHKVLSARQNALSGRKLLRAFSLAHWTLRRTANSFCDSQNAAARSCTMNVCGQLETRNSLDTYLQTRCAPLCRQYRLESPAKWHVVAGVTVLQLLL